MSTQTAFALCPVTPDLETIFNVDRYTKDTNVMINQLAKSLSQHVKSNPTASSDQYVKLILHELAIFYGQKNETIVERQIEKSKKPIKVEKIIKDARTAYIFFCKEKRDEVQAKFPTQSSRFITNELGSMWRNATPETQQIYKAMQEADKQRYLLEKQLAESLPSQASTLSSSTASTTLQEQAQVHCLRKGIASKMGVGDLKKYVLEHIAFYQQYKKPGMTLDQLTFAVNNTMSKTELIDIVCCDKAKKRKQIQEKAELDSESESEVGEPEINPNIQQTIYKCFFELCPEVQAYKTEFLTHIGVAYKNCKSKDALDFLFEEVSDFVLQQGLNLEYTDLQVRHFDEAVRDAEKHYVSSIPKDIQQIKTNIVNNVKQIQLASDKCPEKDLHKGKKTVEKLFSKTFFKLATKAEKQHLIELEDKLSSAFVCEIVDDAISRILVEIKSIEILTQIEKVLTEVVATLPLGYDCLQGYSEAHATAFCNSKNVKEIIHFIMKWRNFVHTESELKKKLKAELIVIAKDVLSDLDVNSF